MITIDVTILKRLLEDRKRLSKNAGIVNELFATSVYTLRRLAINIQLI